MAYSLILAKVIKFTVKGRQAYRYRNNNKYNNRYRGEEEKTKRALEDVNTALYITSLPLYR
jgi:hypothetical protein